jgi:hypothetical protein
MAKLWINRKFLLLLTVIVIAVSLTMMLAQWRTLLSAAGLARVQAIIDNEETIALMLVGLGALLEGREVMSRWVGGPHDATLSEACEYYGFMILTVGLLIEISDQLAAVCESIPQLVLGLQFLVNLPLNIYAIGLLLATASRLWPRPASEHSA